MQINKFFITALCLGGSVAIPQAQAEQNKPLKVCAAENEMPYSNKAGEGFENKLAELVGKALNRKVEYLSWTDPRYYIRDTLDKGLCDVAMGVDKGDPRVLTTQPYYRSGYVFISREADKLNLENWDSEALRKAQRIAFVPGTPPEAMMRLIVGDNVGKLTLIPHTPYGGKRGIFGPRAMR